MKKVWRMKNEKQKNERNAGFTFVETLASLAVGAVLAAGVGISASHVMELARKTSATQTIAQYKMALESYYIDCGRFPTTQQGLEALWSKPVLVPIPKDWNGPYVDKEIAEDPWGNDYVYVYKSDSAYPSSAPSGLPFVIMSYGADGLSGGEGSDADIVSWK